MKYLLIAFVIFTLFACEKDKTNPLRKPSIKIVTPIGDLSIRMNNVLKMQVKADDPDGEIASVAFYSNNQLVFDDTTEPFEHMFKFTETGYHNIKAIAMDNDGLSATSDTIRVSVDDVIRPQVSVNNEPSYSILENDEIVFNVSASSQNGPIIKASLFLNEVLLGEDTSLPFQFTCDTLSAGVYMVHATAEDNEGIIGTSYSYSITVQENTPPTISFYSPNSSKFEFMPGEDIRIYCSANDADGQVEKVEYYANDNLISTRTSDYDFYWKNQPSGTYSLYAKAYDNKGAITTSDTITIKIMPGIIIDGVISDLEYSESDNLVFGLNQTYNKLLLINPVDETMSEVNLPYSQPLSMDYSIQEKKLYIVYKFTGSVSVWDNETQSLSTINFSANDDGRVVRVDSKNRRIYVLSTDGLYILNMDNGSVIASNLSINGASMEIDTENQLVFTAKEGGSPASIYKYSVVGDVISLIQVNNSCGSNPRKIAMNPNKDFLIIPAGGGNGNYYTTYAYDTEDVTNILGEYSIGTYPKYATFTPDGNKLLGTNGDPYDNYIYVMDSYSFFQSEKKYLPNVNDYVRISPNSSGNKIVAYTYNDYNNDDYIIYFFDL